MRCRAAQPRATDGLAQDLGGRLRGVLRGPATRHVDRLAGRCRGTHRRGERRGLAVRAGLAGRDPAGEAGFRLDHLGHVVRRAGARARRAREGPRVGRAGEGSGRVEGGVSAHRPRIGAPAPHRTSGPPGATRPPRITRRPSRGRREPPPRVTMAPDTGPRRRERMQVGLMAPQGWKGEFDGWPADRAWARTLELTAQAEALGFESLWVFDHFHTVPDPTDEITFESFSMLAALAMATTRVRLGHMVVCTGFRNPALTAKLSSTLDVISGGRFELGIGAGWKEDEWKAYGYGFPTIGERMGALGDHLEVITRMLGAGSRDLRGRVRPGPRRHQRPEGPPDAHPDHRRRQRRAGHRRLRRQVRRRAQLRLPRAGRDRHADGPGPGALRDRGPRPRDAAVLDLRPRRAGPRRGRRSGRPPRAPRGDRPRPGRLLPDALVADARGAGARSSTTAGRPVCRSSPRRPR